MRRVGKEDKGLIHLGTSGEERMMAISKTLNTISEHLSSHTVPRCEPYIPEDTDRPHRLSQIGGVLQTGFSELSLQLGLAL